MKLYSITKAEAGSLLLLAASIVGFLAMLFN